MLQTIRKTPDTMQADVKGSGTRKLLRFLTCGSEGDGKSTLIERLLYDCKLLFEDHLAALAARADRTRAVVQVLAGVSAEVLEGTLVGVEELAQPLVGGDGVEAATTKPSVSTKTCSST